MTAFHRNSARSIIFTSASAQGSLCFSSAHCTAQETSSSWIRFQPGRTGPFCSRPAGHRLLSCICRVCLADLPDAHAVAGGRRPGGNYLPGKLAVSCCSSGSCTFFNLLLLSNLSAPRHRRDGTGSVMNATSRQATPKSEATRARILDAALRTFRTRGFHAATMREIASEADVALGAAYYYFDSKNSIVMAFYDQAQQQMAVELERILDSSRSLEMSLRGVIQHKFEHFAPNRALLGALSAHIDPGDPLSPFSAATAAIRDADIVFFERIVEKFDVRLPPTILPYLPRLLWLYQMGLMLYWVYDNSATQARTSLLFEKTMQMILISLKLSRLPFLRPLLRPAAEVLKAVYGEA